MTASIWTPGSNSVPQVDPLNQIKGQQYTATAGQTDFVITQFTYNIGGNALTVYVNSTKVPASELTELSTTSFRIPACEVGDIVEVVGNTATADAGGAAIAAAASAAAALASEGAAAASAAAASAAAAAAAQTRLEGVTVNDTALSGSSVSIPVAVPSGSATEVDIYLAGASCDASGDFLIRLNSDVSEDYFYHWSKMITTSNAVDSGRASGAAAIQATFGNDAASIYYGHIRLTKAAGNRWIANWHLSSAGVEYIGHGYKTAPTGLATVNLSLSSGTFDAGTYTYRVR